MNYKAMAVAVVAVVGMAQADWADYTAKKAAYDSVKVVVADELAEEKATYADLKKQAYKDAGIPAMVKKEKSLFNEIEGEEDVDGWKSFKKELKSAKRKAERTIKEAKDHLKVVTDQVKAKHDYYGYSLAVREAKANL